MWHWERALHLPDEGHVQHVLMASRSLVRAANVYYAWAHFAVMIVFLLWVYLFRPRQYVPLRRLVAAVTGVALVVHLDVSARTATSRARPSHDRHGDRLRPVRLWAAERRHADQPVRGDAVATRRLGADRRDRRHSTTRSRWRWWWLLYPVCTFTVVVGTANHYWLDGVAGAAIVGVTRGPRSRTDVGAVARGSGPTRIRSAAAPRRVRSR